jgi:hypothetical protein
VKLLAVKLLAMKAMAAKETTAKKGCFICFFCQSLVDRTIPKGDNNDPWYPCNALPRK